MNEDEFLLKRLKDLADMAWRKNIYTNTDFLNMAELSVFYTPARSVCNNDNFYRVWGGSEYSERAVILFGNEEEFGYDVTFPVSCIHIKPILKKFADKLTHRDFLGALINLGIKREVLGDIIVRDSEAYVFCLTDMSEFIAANLDRVKHTSVKCQVTQDIPDIWQDNIRERNINVASVRLDAVVGEVYRLSRGNAQELIRLKRVFVNGRICENNSRVLKEDEVISVRGFGKFIYSGLNYVSKKGRSNVKVREFV